MRITLETPSVEAKREFLAAVKRSRKLHRSWVAAPDTPKAFSNWLMQLKSSRQMAYLVRTDTGDLAGMICISEIVRGNFQSGYLGYYAFAPYNGRGFMTLGLKAVVKEAFLKHRFHRLEANIQPANQASIALARRCGFRFVTSVSVWRMIAECGLVCPRGQ